LKHKRKTSSKQGRLSGSVPLKLSKRTLKKGNILQVSKIPTKLEWQNRKNQKQVNWSIFRIQRDSQLEKFITNRKGEEREYLEREGHVE